MYLLSNCNVYLYINSSSNRSERSSKMRWTISVVPATASSSWTLLLIWWAAIMAANTIHGFVTVIPTTTIAIASSRSSHATATTAATESRLFVNGGGPTPMSNSDELFQSENWPSIQEELDTVPIFTCANKQGKPLAYSIELSDGKSYQVPFFYCDVNDAKTELDKAKTDMPQMAEGLDLIPVGLGQVFQMWATDKAVIVPNANAIQQAGAPPNTNPVGQQVPLFACMDIMQEDEQGKACLPLFLVLEEANAAMEQAIQMDGNEADEEFEVVPLSLGRAVELLATAPEKAPAFRFMPPAASISHINDYLTS